MEVSIVYKGGIKNINMDLDNVGIMNHRDYTVDYIGNGRMYRYTLTEKSFNDIIDKFNSDSNKSTKVSIVEK